MPPTRRSLYLTALLLTMLCVVGLLAYTPGLTGGFVFDDNANIVQNGHIHIHELTADSLKGAVLTGISGPLKRPLSMGTFALNYYFAGLDPYAFKLTNVVIHLLNGIGLFFLTRLILAAYRERCEPRLTDRHILVISLSVCAAWLLHPLNLTAVLYIVQRMTSLSALFVIWGLVLYLAGRLRMTRDARAGMTMTLVGVLVFTPLAAFSKENGLLLPLFALVLEYVLFDFYAPRSRDRRLLQGLFGVTIALPALAAAVYTIIDPQWIVSGYSVRDFSLADRLLTESRILWLYIKLILLPVTHQMGLFHDDLAVSHGLLNPPVTLLACAGVGLLLAVAFWSRHRAPLLALGLLWFFAGHILESSVFPLELAAEHRNYLPIYGILLFTIYYLLSPLAFSEAMRARRVLVAGFIVLLGISTASRAGTWGDPALHALLMAANHPQSPRSNTYAGRVYLALADSADQAWRKDQYDKAALDYFQKSAALPGTDLDGMFDSLITLDDLRRPLDAQLVDTLAKRLRYGPFAHNTANQLRGLVKCEERDKCHFSLDVMGRLLQAAIDNPNLKGRTRFAVLQTATEHLVNIVGNYRDALRLARRAVAITPNEPLSHLDYAKLLAATGNDDLAREQLRKSKALDTWGVYTKLITEQENALAQAQGPQPRPQDVKSTSPSHVSDPRARRKASQGA